MKKSLTLKNEKEKEVKNEKKETKRQTIENILNSIVPLQNNHLQKLTKIRSQIKKICKYNGPSYSDTEDLESFPTPKGGRLIKRVSYTV